MFDSVLAVNKPKTVNAWAVSAMINKLLDSTGIRAANEVCKRTELMQTYGFRKYFKTTCINVGMNPLYSEYVMGHRSGLSKSYFKPSENELLEGNEKALGYISAIPDLTIYLTEEQNQRLKQKLAKSKSQHTEEWHIM
jgi:hypothetical protein